MVQTSHEESTRRVDNNCKAHLSIQDVTTQTNAYGTSVRCDMIVQGATDPAQVGKQVTEFFKCDGKAAGMFLNLAEAAGLVTAAERAAAKEAGVGMEIDETLLKAKSICATITMEPKMRKNPVSGKNEVDPEDSRMFPRIGFDTYSVWSAKAADIPLNEGLAAEMPKPEDYTPSQGQAQPPKQQPQQQEQQQPLPLSGQGSSATSMSW